MATGNQNNPPDSLLDLVQAVRLASSPLIEPCQEKGGKLLRVTLLLSRIGPAGPEAELAIDKPGRKLSELGSHQVEEY
ncbi:hypothetical protein FALBO_4244 [Fusarium albosuccineum]|uniref:Uncharacterized protein n=1 Tax=Fusarium albosuccineum TaxID=1237068 RepID=A0A8H4LIQ4_9HYPO|nr:hypothetical protein FALBO_4244 [Fusarium albosuccineum]